MQNELYLLEKIDRLEKKQKELMIIACVCVVLTVISLLFLMNVYSDIATLEYDVRAK